MSYRNKNHLGLGQSGYAAERYVPTTLGQASYAPERYVLGRAPYAEERYIPASLGQADYAPQRYIPMSGLGQTKTGTTTTSKTGTTSGSTTTTKSGTTSGEDNTARDFRTAADVGGSLVGGVIRGFTGGSATPATATDTMATLPAEPAPSGGGADWYWPVVISGGLILVGGIGYFALKGKKKAPTPNKRRKRVSRNAGSLFVEVTQHGRLVERTDVTGWTKGQIEHLLLVAGRRWPAAERIDVRKGGSKRVSKNGYGRSRYGSYSADPRWMAAKYPGVDSEGKSFKKGDEILYWPSTKTVMTGAKAKQAWLDFQSAKGDEEGMPFARNPRRKRTSRR